MTIPTGKERFLVEAAPGAAKGSVWPIRTRDSSARMEDSSWLRKVPGDLVWVGEVRDVCPKEESARSRQ